MPVVQVQTSNTRIRLYEQNEKVTSTAMNETSGAVAADSAMDHLINLALGMMGEFGANPRPLGFKTSFSGNQVTIGVGIVVRSDGIFRYPGGTYTINPASYSGLFEVELSTLYDSPIGKEYINILLETITSASGNSKKNFQIKLYENYSALVTPPTVTVGRIKLFEYIMTAPGGTIVQIQNPIINYDTQTGKIPLTGITYVFDAAYAPASGMVQNGFMLADGSIVPPGYALSGWTTPDLTDSSYIEGSTTVSIPSVGSNSKTLSTSEMPTHGHSMSGSGGNVVTEIFFSGGAAPPGTINPTLVAGAENKIQGSTGDFNKALYYTLSNISIGGTTGSSGSGTAFDSRSKRHQGIPLVRVD